MKKISKIVLICLFVFSGNLNSCRTIQSPKIYLLKIKNMSIKDIIEDFVKEESTYSDVNKNTIIIRIEEFNNIKEMRIGAIDKQVLEIYLLDKKDKPVGYLDYNGITVIVFGVDENTFFEKTNIKKEILLNKIENKLKKRKSKVPPPPLVFEPVIRIYLYKDGEFKLTDKGRFSLLV